MGSPFEAFSQWWNQQPIRAHTPEAPREEPMLEKRIHEFSSSFAALHEKFSALTKDPLYERKNVELFENFVPLSETFKLLISYPSTGDAASREAYLRHFFRELPGFTDDVKHHFRAVFRILDVPPSAAADARRSIFKLEHPALAAYTETLDAFLVTCFDLMAIEGRKYFDTNEED